LCVALPSQSHRNLKVEQCGLVVKPERPFIAATPDGIVSFNCCQKTVLEIKCPYVLSEESVSVGWRKLNFLECNHEILSLKKTHRYFTQVQSQMSVTGCKSARILVWSSKGSLIINIEVDQIFWLSSQEKLVAFFTTYLLGNKRLAVCPQCEKVCLQEDEIVMADDNSILCECCDLWYH